jgi:hypothetical protein
MRYTMSKPISAPDVFRVLAAANDAYLAARDDFAARVSHADDDAAVSREAAHAAFLAARDDFGAALRMYRDAARDAEAE